MNAQTSCGMSIANGTNIIIEQIIIHLKSIALTNQTTITIFSAFTG